MNGLLMKAPGHAFPRQLTFLGMFRALHTPMETFFTFNLSCAGEHYELIHVCYRMQVMILRCTAWQDV